jgi:hypothetical protein
LREERSEHAVTRCQARVKRFRHRAEVLLDAARL